MMTLGSRRFFTAFYDAVSPLLRPRPTIATPPRRTFSSPSTHVRFFGASFVPASWTPRSRYVVSRGFAGFCVCTSVPRSTTGPTSSTAAAAASTVVSENTVTGVGGGLKRTRTRRFLARLGLRGIHTARKGKKGTVVAARKQQQWRSKSDSVSAREENPGNAKPENKTAEEEVHEARGILERVSHIHRPTKDEMLAAATGAWQRLRIRTKWSLIRQMRPYSLEDITAFFSWLLLGHVVWVVVGTTTFLSVAIFLVNSVFAQGEKRRDWGVRGNNLLTVGQKLWRP